MGAGKSVVAAALGKYLALEVIDLDDFIAGLHGRSIRAMLVDDGEKKFREAEKHALRTLLEQSCSTERVIALGGGTWVDEANRHLESIVGLLSGSIPRSNSVGSGSRKMAATGYGLWQPTENKHLGCTNRGIGSINLPIAGSTPTAKGNSVT